MKINLEHLGDDAINPLDTDFYLFSESGFVSNITEGEYIFIKLSPMTIETIG